MPRSYHSAPSTEGLVELLPYGKCGSAGGVAGGWADAVPGFHRTFGELGEGTLPGCRRLCCGSDDLAVDVCEKTRLLLFLLLVAVVVIAMSLFLRACLLCACYPDGV